MVISKKRIIASIAVLSCLISGATGIQPAFNNSGINSTVITADAATTVKAAKNVSVKVTSFAVLNWDKSTDGATGYKVYRRTVTSSGKSSWRRIDDITNVNTVSYTMYGLSSNTTYEFCVKPYKQLGSTVIDSETSDAIKVTGTTYGWGKVTKKVQGYRYTNGQLTAKGSGISANTPCRFGFTKTINGKSYARIDVLEKDNSKSIPEKGITEYKYVGYYVPSSSVTTTTATSIQKQIANQAKTYATTSYKNETYVLGGELYNSTTINSDCSGLTKQCYKLAGYQLYHKASFQGEMGEIIYDNMTYKKTVNDNDYGHEKLYQRNNNNKFTNYSKLKLGDLIIFHEGGLNDVNAVKHIAVYIGNKQMAHFTSRYGVKNNPCRIENLDSFQNQFPISRIVRIVC